MITTTLLFGFMLPFAALDLALIGISAAVIIAISVTGLVIASRWKVVPPNGIGVFYGKNYSVKDSSGTLVKRGFKIVTGGGQFLIPVLERYKVMSTEAFQVSIEESGVPTAKNVPVTIEAMATCRISANPDEQANAVQAFLDKTGDVITKTISEILRGHVRSIIAKLSVEQILRDRAEFNKQVLEESADEFKRLGIQIITLVVQDVSDDEGYIKALGKKETSAIIRDAAIATAEAEKDTKIKVSHTQREAAEVAAQNAVMVADAEKIRDVQVAEFKVQTETKRAQADLANSIAKTGEEKKLRVAEAQRDADAAQAGIAVQEKRAQLKEKELEATILTQARAERTASIISADAKQEVAQRTAKELEIQSEGRKNAAIRDGEGQASKTRSIAAADAEATRVKLTAEADGNKATQLANAEGVRATLLAQAEGSEKSLLATANGKRAALLAEAEGTEKLAAALKTLSEQGRLIMILDRLPQLFKDGGEAGAKMIGAAFGPLGESMGAIKNVSIVDMGGSGGTSGISKFTDSIPQAVAGMVAKMEAMGLDVKPLLKLAKIDPSKLQSMMGMIDTVTSTVDVDVTPAKTETAKA